LRGVGCFDELRAEACLSPNLARGAEARVVICNEMSEIDRVRDLLDGFGHAHGVDPKSIIQLQVVLDELVSNVIKYGWPEGGRHEVEVYVSLAADVVHIMLVDDGKPFSPSDAPARPLNKGQRPRPGGVGIQMVRQLVDAIEYERIDGRNQTRITKRLARTPLQ
jgi:serine/threonine-protein kinase RsbW